MGWKWHGEASTRRYNDRVYDRFYNRFAGRVTCHFCTKMEWIKPCTKLSRSSSWVAFDASSRQINSMQSLPPEPAESIPCET